MEIVKGKGISGGVAIGKLYFYHRERPLPKRCGAADAGAEIERYRSAKAAVAEKLKSLYEKARKEAGEKEAEIFQAHQIMLDDPDFSGSVLRRIREEHGNAESAVGETAAELSASLSSMESDYMRARAADVRDLSEDLISALSGRDSGLGRIAEPVILVADDLLPSETVQIDKSRLLGLLLLRGSSNSHTAILARTMNIPMVIRPAGPIAEAFSGREAALDGSAGTVYLDPDAATAERMRSLRGQFAVHLEMLRRLRGRDNITRDGRKIEIYANIGKAADVDQALQNDAGGIGLFRSEFLYLESADYPSEEEQFSAYKAVLEAMRGKTVIIRTLDIGADKKADYFGLPKEANPAMGFRAIRICLRRPEVFRTQLRALFRASAFGGLGIMFPMIISLEELREAKGCLERVKAELSAEKIGYAKDVSIGIMIETPAAAVISDDLAKEVDFFSIGTNDLTQYTLAVDRQNQELENYYDPHHKAVLRLIDTVVRNGHRFGTKVGICGELGADLSLTETFLSMGVDELSVSPAKVLEVRQKVRESSVGEEEDAILKRIRG